MKNPPDAKTLARFMSKTKEIDGCLVWTGYSAKNAYPMFDLGNTMSARRLMCAWTHGEPRDPNHVAKPICKTAMCVEGSHLAWSVVKVVRTSPFRPPESVVNALVNYTMNKMRDGLPETPADRAALKLPERHWRMYDMVLDGDTLEEIGQQMYVTRQRCGQIVSDVRKAILKHNAREAAKV